MEALQLGVAAAAEERKMGLPVSLFPYSLFLVTDYCSRTEG